MAQFQGKRVSADWAIVLKEFVRQGGKMVLNSGQRTMAEQQALYTQNMYPNGTRRPGRPLTARPSATAPHIKQGHQNHALDVNTYDGGEQRLQNWLVKNGVDAVNNVYNESWHLDPVDEGQLERLADRIRKANRERRRYPTIKHKSGKNKAGHVKRLQRWLRAVGYKSVPGPGQKGYGVFGKRTRWAVARFKRKHRLKGGRGVVGKPMWQALERVMK